MNAKVILPTEAGEAPMAPTRRLHQTFDYFGCIAHGSCLKSGDSRRMATKEFGVGG